MIRLPTARTDTDTKFYVPAPRGQMNAHASSWAPRMRNCLHFRKAEEPECVTIGNSISRFAFALLANNLLLLLDKFTRAAK